MRFGSISLNRMREVGAPSTWADWMNSLSRSESTWPRISRARNIQLKMMRMNISVKNWTHLSLSWSVAKREVMIGARASAPSRNGNDRKRSITKEMVRSGHPRV